MMLLQRAAVGFLLLTAITSADEPWRLNQALTTPDWLTVSGTYRLRYETLDNPFRASARGSDQILVERLLLHVSADFDTFYFGAELEDSRAWIDDDGTAIGDDHVNAAELLRAYAGLRRHGVFHKGDSLDIRAGRITMDIGSRRLAARNRYRNTINGFTGVHGVWTSKKQSRVETFFILPVNRRPVTFERLAANAVQFDNENLDALFWGVVASREHLFRRVNGEIYIIGLSEKDRPDQHTLNRRLYTPGFRVFSTPMPGRWDLEVEGALQFGMSRLTTSAADITDLDHRAGMFHGHVARTFSAPWSPRLALQYDFAGGDRDPEDDRNNRFDTLFGARRFEFGPTGIYGFIARSNISAPGIRIEARPHDRLSGFAGYRAVFLASSRDALTTAELQDRTGSSGRFVGQQMEGRLRYAVLPGNLRIEVGGAYLIHGRFLRSHADAPRQGDTVYLYTQSILTF